MTLNIEREKVKEKVAKFLNMTVDRGASESEARTAAEKAAELMAHFDIQISELSVKSARAIQQEVLFKKYGRRKLARDNARNAHPVVPGSPICGMRMPCGGRLRRAQEGIEWLASNRCVDSPARAKGPRNCHRHADKQLKAPEKLNLSPASDFTRQP